VNEGNAEHDTIVESTIVVNDNIVVVIQLQQVENGPAIKAQHPEVSNLFTLVTENVNY